MVEQNPLILTAEEFNANLDDIIARTKAVMDTHPGSLEPMLHINCMDINGKRKDIVASIMDFTEENKYRVLEMLGQKVRDDLKAIKYQAYSSRLFHDLRCALGN